MRITGHAWDAACSRFNEGGIDGAATLEEWLLETRKHYSAEATARQLSRFYGIEVSARTVDRWHAKLTHPAGTDRGAS